MLAIPFLSIFSCQSEIFPGGKSCSATVLPSSPLAFADPLAFEAAMADAADGKRRAWAAGEAKGGGPTGGGGAESPGGSGLEKPRSWLRIGVKDCLPFPLLFQNDIFQS